METSKFKELPIDHPARRRLPIILRRSWYGLNQAFRRRIMHIGITPDQFTALRTLVDADSEGMTQREIADSMASDPNTVASLLERMEKAKLLVRAPHEKDRRARRVRLLEAGHEKYQIAREIAVSLQQEVLEGIPEKDREDLLKKMLLVADACQEALEASPILREQKKSEN